MASPDISTLTDADLEATRVAVLTEQGRRLVVASAQQQVESITAIYADAVSRVAPTPIASIPAGQAVGPGGKIVWTDGNTWQNKSGAWLAPSVAGPGVYPLGWTQLTGLSTAPAWSAASVAYKVGDLVTYQGATYRCLQAHTANASWTPTAAVSLWTLA